MIPDVVPQEQHSLANSYISLAIGLGSVVAAATAPVLKLAFGYQMSIPAQFIMAALAFTLAMTWTCLTIHEKSTLDSEVSEKKRSANWFLAVYERVFCSFSGSF